MESHFSILIVVVATQIYICAKITVNCAPAHTHSLSLSVPLFLFYAHKMGEYKVCRLQQCHILCFASVL